MNQPQTMDSLLESSGPYGPFLKLFPIEFCRRAKFVVALPNNTRLPVAFLESFQHVDVADVAGRALKTPLKIALASQVSILRAVNQFYEQHAKENASYQHHPSLIDALDGSAKSISTDDLLESETRGPVVQLVNQLLFDAIQGGASDIHLQPFEDHVSVRLRLDGVLTAARSLPKSLQDEVISRIKVAGNMDIAEKRLPQDGRATVRVGERVIDLRLASMPTNHGERLVIRLLDKSARLYRLGEIGMERKVRKSFQDLIQLEHGLVLVTGPTGSGKSTTLYAALQELDTKTRNAVTLEDPIEYQLDGVSQTQIHTKKGMTFASGLRSVLRQDPDIIMLGEIRDQETAVMAIQSALTGHMVFSTLHTNDAASAVTRLLDLGIEPYLVSSSLIAVLAQRLVRRTCASCHGQIKSAECPHCRGTGFKGREGIYELLIVDDQIRELIQDRRNATEIRNAAVQSGMKLLNQCGLEKVLAGVTTEEEIFRVTMRVEC